MSRKKFAADLSADPDEIEASEPEFSEPEAAAGAELVDEFEKDGHRYRRIHRLEGNRWIDRCVLIEQNGGK